MMGENGDALGGLFASWRSTVYAKQDQGGTTRTAPGDPWRGAHRINPQRYNQRLSTVFIEEIVQPPPDVTLVGFKEVRYFDYGPDLPAYLDYIRATFTPALLVFNRRKGEEVAGSAWWKDHPGDIAAEVAVFDATTTAYALAHPDQSIVVNYREWSRDPEYLRPLFDRLGVPLDVASLRRILSEPLNH
jgi:hypothetical protein